MGVGGGLYMYVVVVQKFTFAISSPDELLLYIGLSVECSALKLVCLHAQCVMFGARCSTDGARWHSYRSSCPYLVGQDDEFYYFFHLKYHSFMWIYIYDLNYICYYVMTHITYQTHSCISKDSTWKIRGLAYPRHLAPGSPRCGGKIK